MLKLEPLNPTKRVFHPESGAYFTLSHLSGEAYQALRKECMRGGEVDVIAFNKRLAMKVIQGWEGVEGECTPETKAKFGAAFVFTIMPWIIDEAMALSDMIAPEESEGKDS